MNFDQNAEWQCRWSPKPAEAGERQKNVLDFANNANFEASEALKQPNFDLSNGANGAQNEVSIER